MSRAPRPVIAFTVVATALLLAAALNGFAVVALSRWAIAPPGAAAPPPPEPTLLHVPAQAFQSPFPPASEPQAAEAAAQDQAPPVDEAPTATPRERPIRRTAEADPAPDDGAVDEAVDEAARLAAWEAAPVDLSSHEGMLQAFTTGDDGAIWVRRAAFEAFNRDEGLQRAHAPRRVVLVREGDEAVGLRVEGLRSSSAYGLLGLRDGDILRYVNGTHLDSPQRGMAVYSAIQTADTVALTVRRGGADRTLVYRVR